MKLTVTLSDNGKPREAIPVRAVPLVTDWFISADSIAIALAGEDGVFRYSYSAYVQADGEIEEIHPADWRLIANRLHALSKSLPNGEAGKYEWEHRSLAELPAAAFVWADEFANAYRREFQNAEHLELFVGELLHATGEVRIPVVLPDQMQSIALEGFHGTPKVAATKKSSGEIKHQSTNHTNDTRIRTSQLTAEIVKAKQNAIDPTDYLSVWAELSKMALDETGAFTGVTDPKKGLEYKAHNSKGEQTKKWFTCDALRKRMNPTAR